MSHLRILFLGAGKRLSLLELFLAAGKSENVDLELHAVEFSERVPIASIASIHVGPGFNNPIFNDWLIDLSARVQADIVIPNMDSATIALAQAKSKIEATGAWAVVSDMGLCKAMYDKQESEDWFLRHSMPVPGRTCWPRILKKRFGFGSHDQMMIRDENERSAFLLSHNLSEYIEQNFIEGPEYTVDAYVARDGGLVAAMSRKRLKVLDGEVEESISEYHPRILAFTEKLFSFPGWQGPLTVQFIDGSGGPVLIEVNPRFGGGVTHSIHCGLDFPAWILRERLKRSLPDSPSWTEGSFMTRCRRDIFL
jgi:carbamoyl-phosphate synthase large subunit